MKSKYKRLGDYIIESKARNEWLKAETLLWINIDKFFMPSVANVIGTDMSVYKTVKRNQFACNRMHVGRDYRLPISMSRIDKEFIVSPAYDVFEIRDTDVLDPEYLMMWFSRSEFDRNAWFYTDADVRGGLHWKAFCDMQLPIPSIEKQRQIVVEYNVIQNRITLNQELIQKLEETAQAIYKQWFVDFEFPDKNGKPYKSNGGEMVESEFGDIPKGWKHVTVNEFCDIFTGRKDVNETVQDGDYIFFSCSPETFLSNEFIYDGEAVLIAWNGSYTGRVSYFHGKFDLYQRTYAVVAKDISLTSIMSFIYICLKVSFEPKFLGGSRWSSIPYIVKGDISDFVFVYSSDSVDKFESIMANLIKDIHLIMDENNLLIKMKQLLLSKLATIEN